MSDDADTASDIWGDIEGFAGVVPTDGSDLTAIQDALSGGLTGDRAEADRVATLAAGALQALARAGHTGVSAVLSDCVRAVRRHDDVALPAMGVLAAAGSLNEVPDLVGVIVDDGRSNAARAAAADACAEIFGREGGASAAALDQLHAVLTSDADLEVRQAVARAMGRLDLDPSVRAELLRTVRVNLGE